IGKLREGHGEKLIPASQTTNSLIAIVSLKTSIEFVMRYKLHDLRKHCSSLMHDPSSSWILRRIGLKNRQPKSNRLAHRYPIILFHSVTCMLRQKSKPDSSDFKSQISDNQISNLCISVISNLRFAI